MENQVQNQNEERKKQQDSGKGGVIAGWILVTLGVLFLLNNFDILDFAMFWPLVLIAIGIVLLVRRSA